MNDAPRYVTLLDYLRVLRRQRVLIGLITLAVCVAAYAWSELSPTRYRAESSLSFRDTAEDFSFVGTPIEQREPADQKSARFAALATRPKVAVAVKRRLRTSVPAGTLESAVEARAEARTNFVVIEASWKKDPLFTQKLANTWALEVARITRREEQARYREAADSLRRRLRNLTRNARNDPVTRATLQERVSRLESLEDFSRPVEIAELARIPTSPYSPKPVRNVLVGLLLGFALGALVAFIRDALDRRLRGSRDIQHRLRLPVLARVRKEALGQTGAIANNGRRRAINEADLEAFRVLRTNLEFLDPQRRIRSVLVTSALPEEGKSTVAASLAGANALAGKRTLLIECDLRQPVLAARLGVKPGPGLTDYLAGKATPQEIFQEVSVGQPAGMSGGALRGPPPITCVTAGREALPPGETLGSGGFQDFLAVVARSYDSVIIDAGPVLSVADTLELIGQVDGVLVCVRASRTTGEQASALKTALDHFPARPAGIVVTGAEPDDEGGASYYAYDDSVAAPEQGSPAR